MPRKKISKRYKLIKKKKIIIGSFLLNLLIGKLIKDGNKNLAKRFIKNIIVHIENKINLPFSMILEKAIKNISPKFKLTSINLSTSNSNKKLSNVNLNQVIVELTNFESIKIGLSWLIKGSKARNMRTLSQGLAIELFEAFRGKGNAIRYRLDLYQKAKFLRVNS